MHLACLHPTPLPFLPLNLPPFRPPPPPTSLQVTGSWAKAQYTFDQGKARFEKGSADHFAARIPDCGDLQSVRFWHDGSGFGSDWCA